MELEWSDEKKVGKVHSICVPTIGKGLTTAKLHRRGGLGGRD